MTSNEIDQVVDEILNEFNPEWSVKEISVVRPKMLPLFRQMVKTEYRYAMLRKRFPDAPPLAFGECELSIPMKNFIERNEKNKTKQDNNRR